MLMDSIIGATCKDLADAGDLLNFFPAADLTNDEGYPDEAKILFAESDLLNRKPHLRSRAPSGVLDQGPLGVEVQEFSFSDWLRNAAG